MPAKKSPASKKVKAKTSPQNTYQNTDADKIRALEEQLAQREAELAILNSIQTALASKLDFQGIIDVVGEKVGEIFKDGNVGFAFLDKAREVITFPYIIENRKRIEYFELALAQSGLMQHILKRRRPVVINSKFGERFEGIGTFNYPGRDQRDLKSWVTVPIFNGDEIIGGASLRSWDRENAFSDSDVRLLQTIVNSMSVALENVRLFDETQRLLKETEQRTTELQIINNIGQTLTEGFDLQSTLEHVGEKLRILLQVNDFGITAFDLTEKGLAIYHYVVRNGQRIIPENFSLSKYRLGMRLAAQQGGKPWVVNNNAAKYWDKIGSATGNNETPKSFVMLPMRADMELVGSITIADFEKEHAFTGLPMEMLETIASNIGTAIQNIRLMDETKRLFRSAQESRAAAEQANKAKSTFLANMSHELRTPLHAIIGFTEIVKEKSEGVLPQKQIGNLDKVLTSSQHLLGLINSVLDLAKIEAGRMDIIPAKFNLPALIDLCGTLSTPLLKPNVTLAVEIDETIRFVYSDQDKIKQILLNLLSNAAKFTHTGHILLRVEKSGPDTLSISVSDSGIGISAEALGRIFEEFQQADTTTTRQYGGTGLGLTISRTLAHLLGGDLTVTSELGKGSTFTLTIPIQYGRKPASVPDPQPAATQSTESNIQAGSSQS